MSFGSLRESGPSGPSSFRKAIKLVLLSGMMALQGGDVGCANPHEEWDNTDYLYKDLAPIEEQPAPKVDPAEKKDQGFDILHEEPCTEDTCKFA